MLKREVKCLQTNTRWGKGSQSEDVSPSVSSFLLASVWPLSPSAPVNLLRFSSRFSWNASGGVLAKNCPDAAVAAPADRWPPGSRANCLDLHPFTCLCSGCSSWPQPLPWTRLRWGPSPLSTPTTNILTGTQKMQCPPNRPKSEYQTPSQGKINLTQ